MDKKKILVVDDEPDFVSMIKMRLESSGYEVITSSNGKEGLEKVDSEKPDVVFLDILMPELNGLEALKRIKQKNKDLPVYIITAFSNEERFKEARDLGASGFIVKSGDFKKEIQDITNFLNIADKYKG